jgi:formate hydrogenlyase subunit 3/multisubunit Na+/H+ antiporter MnhD subunit
MNTLSQLSFFGLSHILLQNTSSAFQMNLALYLAVAVFVLTVVVMAYVYRVLQIVLVVSGLKDPNDEVLTIQWVKVLFVLTIGLGVASFYIYTKLI